MTRLPSMDKVLLPYPIPYRDGRFLTAALMQIQCAIDSEPEPEPEPENIRRGNPEPEPEPPDSYCRNCGGPIYNTGKRGPKKKFCSSKCLGYNWWLENKSKGRWGTSRKRHREYLRGIGV